jgi:hypothetical protein
MHVFEVRPRKDRRGLDLSGMIHESFPDGRSDIFLTQGEFSVCDANSWIRHTIVTEIQSGI